MKTLQKSLLLLLSLPVICATSTLFAQHNFGAVSSNYCPTNGVKLNPASMANSKTWLDINILGVGAYANNNMVMIPDNTILGVKDLPWNDPEKTNVYFDARNRDAQAFARVFASGPGATWCKGDHAAGLSFGVRSYTGLQHLSKYIGRFIEHDIVPYTKQHGINFESKDIRLASISFGEIQGSYAYTFYKEKKDMFSGGISLKKFYSIAGGAANINDLSLNVRNTEVISVFELNGDAMYTPSPKLRGKGGMGMDLGVTYQKMMTECRSYKPHTSKSGCRAMNYKYKAGFSIIDIGSLKFQEEDILYAGYSISSYEIIDYAHLQGDTANPLNFVGDPNLDLTQGSVKKPNKIKLPTYLSAQFDYNVWASAFYLNATIVQGLPRGASKFGTRHANSLSITPRFETRLIDFALPFSLYQYKSPQLGMYLRIGPITIGSDKFVNWIINSDLYGGDIYFYAKVPIFYHPKCRKSMRSKMRGQQFRFGKSSMNCSF